MKGNLWIFGFGMVLWTACSGTVDVPEPKSDAPVFTAELDTEDDMFNWEAGRENYEAKADYILKGKDLTFISILKNRNCDRDCPQSLTVALESAIDFDRDFRMEDAITLGTKNFTQRRLADSLLMIVRTQQFVFRNQGRWTLNGKDIKFRMSNDSLLFQIPSSGWHELCLTNVDDFGNQYIQCQTYSGQDLKAPRPVIQIERANDVFTLKAVDRSGLLPREIEGRWNYKNQSGESIRLNLVELKDMEICYTAKKGGSQATGKACVRLTSRPGTDFPLELDYQIVRLAKPQVQIIRSNSSVEMTYIDAQGIRYLSSLSDSRNNLFEILEVEEFNDPVLNKSLRKVKCQFSGELKSLNGQVVKVRRAGLVLPFAVVE